MARLANVTKAVSNTYRYVSKQPVGAAVFLIALDLARRVAQSPVGVSVRDAIGSFVGGRAVVLDQMRRDLTALAAGITASGWMEESLRPSSDGSRRVATSSTGSSVAARAISRSDFIVDSRARSLRARA